MKSLSQPDINRYHFHVYAGGTRLHESDALAFNDLAEVWHEGAMTTCDMIHAMYGKVEPATDWRLEVLDGLGNVIYRFSFQAEKLIS